MAGNSCRDRAAIADVPSVPVADPRRILLIRPSALGDVCRTVPVLASLRAHWPDSRIDWLVNDAFAPVIASHPALSGVVRFPRSDFARWWSPPVARRLRRWLRESRDAGYDLVIDCQGLLRSGWFARATGAPVRVGYANAPELAWLGYNRRCNVDRSMHTVDRMLALLEPVGVPALRDMRLYSGEADRAAIAGLLGGASPGERLAVIAPTSRWPAKRWPAERFAQLTRAILDRGCADRVAIVGAPGEEPQCAPVTALSRADSRVIDLVGRCTVGGLLAVIERSSLVVANDSAALHIAVGFDRPIVALFGPTDISLVGPYRRAESVVQRLEQGDRLDHKNERPGSMLMARITLGDAIAGVDRALNLPAAVEHAR
jgi:lipopolysaccharide heptosyltransferase I